MQASDFQKDAPGRLLKNLQGHVTFLPNPLPPPFKWSSQLGNALSQANWALGRLSGIGQSLANPHLLIHPFVRREAVLSSQIEGTQATLQDLFLFEQAAPVEERVPDVREVANYVRALEYGLQIIKARRVTLSLVKGLHRLLMEGVRGGDKTPGSFRTIQNFIGRTARIEEATYVPPPPLEVEPAMRELERFATSFTELPALIRIAMVHYQFEAIHPFQDGNGRVGRLLVSLLFSAEGLLPVPLLYLSAYFERHRAEYYRGLLEVSQAGAWDAWIEFFLRGIEMQSVDAIDRAHQLSELRGAYHRRVQRLGLSAKAIGLIDELFATPAITVGRAARVLEVTFNTAQRMIDRLVDDGILAQAAGQKRNRIYLAPEILRVLDSDRD